jgi:hypothetical protein
LVKAGGEVKKRAYSKGTGTAASFKGGTNVFSSTRARYLVAATLLAASACAGNRSVPATGIGAYPLNSAFAPDAAVDMKSVLKALKKNTLIGSTVDPTNGDKAPHGLTIAGASTGSLTKGQLVTCNFSNKSNAAGQGTTVEVLDAKAGSKPTQFAQNAAFKGCAAIAITAGNTVYGTAFAGKSLAQFGSTGAYRGMKSSAFVAPFGALYTPVGTPPYQELIVFATDASKGSVLRIDITYFTPPKPKFTVTAIATGFAVNKKPGTKALGPSGLAYNAKSDTLYIVDGVDNTVVAFAGAGKILLANAVTVQPGGKTFKYNKQITKPFASLVFAGSPLKSPVASTLLPNGNLIVANTKGNSLVEMTPTGKVLDTKVVETKAAPAVFGLASAGTSDANTVLYYTNAISNTVQLLQK